MVTGGVPPEVKLGDVHLGVLGPRVRLFQPDVQLLDLVLHIITFDNLQMLMLVLVMLMLVMLMLMLVMLMQVMLVLVLIALLLNMRRKSMSKSMSMCSAAGSGQAPFVFLPLFKNIQNRHLVLFLPPPRLLLGDLQLLLVLADGRQLVLDLHNLQLH